jgi:hypothetical protein
VEWLHGYSDTLASWDGPPGASKVSYWESKTRPRRGERQQTPRPATLVGLNLTSGPSSTEAPKPESPKIRCLGSLNP